MTDLILPLVMSASIGAHGIYKEPDSGNFYKINTKNQHAVRLNHKKEMPIVKANKLNKSIILKGYYENK